jgi:hypothetical protein
LQKTVKKWRFAEVDYSSAKNDFGGFYNVSSHPVSDAYSYLCKGLIINNPSKNMGCLLKKN